mmetsp:Transcript_28201/g.39673  ORF Transcript_28201/g.39673 Transcript_28201/m.39673 type:complete len:255 (+) Transcript_28201:97-861(+)
MRVLDEEVKLKNAEMGSVTTGTASEDPTYFSSSKDSLSQKIEQKYRSNKRMFVVCGIILVAGMIAIAVGVGMGFSNSEEKEKKNAVVVGNDQRKTSEPSASPTMAPTLNAGSWDLEFLDMETNFGSGFGNNRGQIRLQYLAHLRDVQVTVLQNDCIAPLPNPTDVTATIEMEPDSNKSKGILSVFFNVKRDTSVWVVAPDNKSGAVNYCVRTELVVVDEGSGEAIGVNFRETIVSINVEMSTTGDFLVDVNLGT